MRAGVCLPAAFFLPVGGGLRRSSQSPADYPNRESTGNGERIKYPAFAAPEVSALEVDIAVGAETGWHKHPVAVYGYVLAGLLQVDMEGGKLLTFKPGDAIIEVVDAWHNGRNVGCEPVRMAASTLAARTFPTSSRARPTWARIRRRRSGTVPLRRRQRADREALRATLQSPS